MKNKRTKILNSKGMETNKKENNNKKDFSDDVLGHIVIIVAQER